VTKRLLDFGFTITATRGTATVLQRAGLDVTVVNKVHEGRPHIVDMIKNDEIDFIVNTTEGEQAVEDSVAIRRNAVLHRVCYVTTLAGAEAACRGLMYPNELHVLSLQELHSA